MIWSNTANPAGLRSKSDLKMPLISYVAFIFKGQEEKESIKKLRVLTFALVKQYNFKCMCSSYNFAIQPSCEEFPLVANEILEEKIFFLNFKPLTINISIYLIIYSKSFKDL